jgi:hypothetical protein
MNKEKVCWVQISLSMEQAESLFDITLGFKFNTGLKLEVSSTNLLNNEFRALPGLPKIGRTASARLLLDL